MCNLGAELVGNPQKRILKSKPIIGYRWCRLESSPYAEATGVMTPVAMYENDDHNPWTRKIAKADQAPTVDNENGLHIFRSKKHALNDKPMCDHNVLLKVRIWGNAVEHDNGYRVTNAQIIAASPSNKPLFLKGLAKCRALKGLKIVDRRSI